MPSTSFYFCRTRLCDSLRTIASELQITSSAVCPSLRSPLSLLCFSPLKDWWRDGGKINVLLQWQWVSFVMFKSSRAAFSWLASAAATSLESCRVKVAWRNEHDGVASFVFSLISGSVSISLTPSTFVFSLALSRLFWLAVLSKTV